MPKNLLYILILFTAVLCSSSSSYEQRNTKEYELKAAFIYNFTKYLELNNNSPTFVIGVLGNSPIIEPLENYSINKKIDDKKIEIVKLLNTSEIKNCQIVFMPEFVSFTIIQDFLNLENSKKTLVITEKIGALEAGSSINFLIIDNKIKFEINQAALNKNNIKASSQLLKLAVRIKN